MFFSDADPQRNIEMKFLIPKSTELERLPLLDRLFWRGFHYCMSAGGENRKCRKVAETSPPPAFEELGRLPWRDRRFWQGYYFCQLGGQNRKTGRVPAIKKWVPYTGISITDFFEKLHERLGQEDRVIKWRAYLSVCPDGMTYDEVYPRRGKKKK